MGNPYITAITKGSHVTCSTGSLASGYYSLQPDGTWRVHPDSDPIAVGQGFLVQATEAATLSFNDNTGSKSISTSPSNLTFTVSNGEYEDIAVAQFCDEKGLRKIAHLNNEAPLLSIPVNGRHYALATLADDTHSFPLALQALPGEYTISVEINGNMGEMGYCHLIDRETGTDIDLLHDSTYSFKHSGNQAFADRFLVKLSPNAQGALSAQPTNFAHFDGDRLTINGSGLLQVFDILGRKIGSLSVNGTVSVDPLKIGIDHSGIYLLRLGGQSQKIVKY